MVPQNGKWTGFKYLANYLNINDNRIYKTRASEHNNIKIFRTRTENFKQSFFTFCVHEWWKLDVSLRKAKNIKRFKSMSKDLFNLKQKSLFTIHDLAGAKLLPRLRLLKQQITCSCVYHFLQKIDQKRS